MSYSTNIVIHINEKMADEKHEKFIGAIRQIQGVVSANVEGRHPHLMIVGYNPQDTKPVDIVKQVRKTGVHAQLIAWL